MTQKKKAAEKSLFDILTKEQKDFFIVSLEKKVRNLNKKLKEIKQLQEDQKEGKELKDSQLQKISSQGEHISKIKEFEDLARFYLETKNESALEQEAPATQTPSITEVVSQVVSLYYASQFSNQTNSNPQLANIYDQVFHNHSANRVAESTTQVVNLIPELQAVVNQIVSSEIFSHHQIVTVAEVVFDEQQQDNQEVVTEVVVQVPQQVVQEVPLVNEEVQQAPEIEEQKQENQQPQQTEEGVAPVQGDQDQQAPVQGEKKYRKRNYDGERPPREHKDHHQGDGNQEGQERPKRGPRPHKHHHEGGEQQEGQEHRRRGPRNDGQNNEGGEQKEGQEYRKRGPRNDGNNNEGGEQKEGQEHRRRGPRNDGQNNEGGEQKEGQENRRRGPRNSGNRQPKQEGSAEDNQGVAEDGWNVVKKKTGVQEGGYKPRTHHVHREHKEGAGTSGEHDGSKKPHHSGNRRPYNKEKPQGGNQYVRKEQSGTDAPQTGEKSAQQETPTDQN